jgi:hypothetical protein
MLYQELKDNAASFLEYNKEKKRLNDIIRPLVDRIARFRGNGTPGNYFRGWNFSESAFDDVGDEIPGEYLCTWWEYADCGHDPYYVPVAWLDMSEEEWKQAITDELEEKKQEEAAKKKAQAEARLLAREDADRKEYLRLKEKFEGNK